MMKKIACTPLLVLVVWLSLVSASHGREFIRESVRARGMGNAFTAVANDDYALFYNPAGLQSVPVHMFELFGFDSTINQVLLDLFGSVPGKGDSDKLLESFSNVAGKRFSAEGGLSGLNITAPGWGYSLFANSRFDVGINNPTVPYFDFQVYAQAGSIFGFAFSALDYDLDIGLAVKALRRTGIKDELHFVDFGPLIQGDLTQLEDKYSTTTAYAPDLGMTYHIDRFHFFPLRLSLVVQNIGGLDFDGAGVVPMQMNGGIASELELGGLDVLLAADALDMLGAQEGKSYVTDLKLGTEVGLFRLYNGHHLLSLRFGLNGVYTSYGLSLNLFGAKIDYANWSEEVGGSAGAQEDQRQSFRFSILF